MPTILGGVLNGMVNGLIAANGDEMVGSVVHLICEMLNEDDPMWGKRELATPQAILNLRDEFERKIRFLAKMS